MRKAIRGRAAAVAGFNAPRAFLSGMAKAPRKYGRGETIFTPGDACTHVLYIQTGVVKLSVLSETGREAVVAMLGPGEFFGERCLVGQPVRTSSATAITPSVILRLRKGEMTRSLHRRHAISDQFIAQMLSRNGRIEQDLIDHLFDSIEKRLARTLLRLARYGEQDKPARVVKISLEALAEAVGATRARIEFFLNKFNTQGFIEYDRERPLTINNSLLTVVLDD